MERVQAKLEEEGRTKKKRKEPKEEDEEAKEKPKGDEALKLKVVWGSAQKGGKTKLLTMRSPLPLEDVVINEVVDYMQSDPLRAHIECRDPIYDELPASLSQLYKATREFDASVIQQYRVNGYVDLQLQFEVNDDEQQVDEELTS